MYWDEKVVQKLEWNGEISNLEEKQKMDFIIDLPSDMTRLLL